MADVTLYGRIILTGTITAKTGLHIGGSAGTLGIGNVDMPVIRNKDGVPYIPGSSLKGKMRSLSEKLSGAPQNKSIGEGVHMHVAESVDEYRKYWVNPVFGVPGEIKFNIPAPTRLVVRDVPLQVDSLKDARTDLPFSEIKWEAAIDRVTSAATPRQLERVPAGAVFSPMELVFSVFQKEDMDLFMHVLTALRLVEDDYLGGQGTRGSGKVAFTDLKVTCKRGKDYAVEQLYSLGALADVSEEKEAELRQWIGKQIAIDGG